MDKEGVASEDATLPATEALMRGEREEDEEGDTDTVGVPPPTLLVGERRGDTEVVEEREGDPLPLPLPLPLPVTVVEEEMEGVERMVGESKALGVSVTKGVAEADWVEEDEGDTPSGVAVMLGEKVPTPKVALSGGVKVIVISEDGEGDTMGVFERTAEGEALKDAVECSREKEGEEVVEGKGRVGLIKALPL